MSFTGHRYVLADVFTTQRFGGNSLAVFPSAETIPPAVMPKIARELNLSETVFVLPPASAEHTAKLRIVTPGSELPFAGHPTVGTACILASLGRVPLESGRGRMILEEGVGPISVAVTIAAEHLSAKFEVATLPEFGPAPPEDQTLAELLSIPLATVGDGELRPLSVSCGVPFLFIPVHDREVLARVRLNLSVWEAELRSFWAPHVYVITRDEERGDVIHARMFAPAMGIAEDPATGGAAAALPGYLWRHGARPGTIGSIRVEQGFDLGRPSVIEVETEVVDGAIAGIRVGGNCVVVGEGEMYVDA